MGKGQRTLAPRRRLAGAAFKPPCGAAAGNDAVLSGQGKGKQNLSGSCCEDERKQTPDEASKQKNVCIKTSIYEQRWDQYGGYLSTGHMVHGVKGA